MFSHELIESIPAWLSNGGPDSDCIISSRIRLARNVAGHQFPLKASLLERKHVFEKVSDAIHGISYFKSSNFLNLSDVEKVKQLFLLENRVISNELINSSGDRGVVCDSGSRISIMVNEEDHIRMQCMDSGYQPDLLWDTINSIDDELGKLVTYAYDTKLGFLTSCPTNSGTGLRVSFLLHLPGLVLTKTIDSVLSGASQMGISIRGFFGEYSDVIGNFFQLSNQATMGSNEEGFLQNTKDIILKIKDYEHAARDRILKDAKSELKDKVLRSYGILRYAHTLSIDEFLNLISAIRIGIDCGIMDTMKIEELNKIMLLCLPAHLKLFHKGKIKDEDENFIRAELVKKLLP